MLACFKIRAVPVNVNFRYVEGELRYCSTTPTSSSCIVHDEFATAWPRRPTGPSSSTCWSSTRGLRGRAGRRLTGTATSARPHRRDDLYCVYTGGTTGMPKGVVWRHEDIFFAAMGGGDPMQSRRLDHDARGARRAASREPACVALLTPPLMHVSAHWLRFSALFGGGTVVLHAARPLRRRRDLAARRREKASTSRHRRRRHGAAAADALDGDARARTTCRRCSSSAPAARSCRRRPRTSIAELLPERDRSSTRSARPRPGDRQQVDVGRRPSGRASRSNEQTAVLDDDLRPVAPGLGRGRPAGPPRPHPARLLQGPGEDRRDVRRGRRRALGRCPATWRRSTPTARSRCSAAARCASTPAARRSTPKRSRPSLKAHPDVFDAVVVGVPDERWGERVVAVVQPRAGRDARPSTELQEHCRATLAGLQGAARDPCRRRDRAVAGGQGRLRWAKREAMS